jgi:hypothetical protein
MADYFTNFSMILPLPSEAAQTYAADLAEQAFYIQTGDEPMPNDFPLSLRDVVEDWRFETVPNNPADGGVCGCTRSGGGIDAVCAFIEHLLARFDPAGHATLEWSNDCSKPRVDAFGGGAALITARKVKTLNTGEWLHRQVARLDTSTRRQPIAGS